MNAERLLICRHAKSTANLRNHEAFGSPDAGLTPRGMLQSGQLGSELENRWGIDPETTPVAVSRLRRSGATARRARFFTGLTQYAVLDEVEHGCSTAAEWQEVKAKHTLQPDALQESTEILRHFFDPDSRPDEHKPRESVWITHGYRIAHLIAAARALEYDVRVHHTEEPRDDFIVGHCDIVAISSGQVACESLRQYTSR